ncbi:MupA/Atu3671 family FMN-dependent luciferase-like monooxygenase [Streptomyces sp. NPDC090052]|uniref:MupA/Atu3671 family FMN-dependent luciferase-like monooxygenase n=1 Tax=unclassified Streptomyces TaxID=2593676 RepID=UPI00225603A2|nr:MupA/Atu3671 family FMN-dependent luciferase-like monooxygenase [Streptomyces sp. NBC_01306]MCX4728901.1 LLM class flavin-dependent oxidoreductase [Streptomyces sp. NBC_01306]WSX46381.1 LLM class flavin-dependent oxidoreductase [Streptomyces sp. NBC_00963]
MDTSIFFFSAEAEAGGGADPYALVKAVAARIDDSAMCGLWTPERHFNVFGGLYPNPSVLGAALAVSTSRVAIRAGSVVLPLHDPVRVAEEWSVVDNLSAGRAEIAFSSGWHANDFVLAPQAYSGRVESLDDAMDRFTRLWHGDAEKRSDGNGDQISVTTYPRPHRADIPLWMSGQSETTFLHAARRGTGIVTNFTGRRFDDLERRIALYRSAFVPSRHTPSPRVGLMLHTYIHDDPRAVADALDSSYEAYIRRHLDLQLQNEAADISAADLDDMVATAKGRLRGGGGLVGDKAACAERIRRFGDIGVTEIACLVDFGIDPELVLESLDNLDDVASSVQ